MTASIGAGAGATKRTDRNVVLAWVCVALLPGSTVLAMLVGEGLAARLGYPGGELVPLRVALLSGLPAVLILITPGIAAVVFGRRARRAGTTAADLPAWIGGVAAALSVVLNAAGLVAIVLGLPL